MYIPSFEDFYMAPLEQEMGFYVYGFNFGLIIDFINARSGIQDLSYATVYVQFVYDY
jgi:hypothetical protein